MRTSARTPNLLSNLSKNEYVVFSLLWFGNGTNSNHLEKCSIITKTYQLCKGVKLNGPAKSKLHEYPSPIIGKGYRWNVGTLKDARNRSHTIHLKTNCWTYNCFHVVLSEAQPSFVHLPTFVGGNYLSIWTAWSHAQHNPFPWVLIQLKLHLIVNMQWQGHLRKYPRHHCPLTPCPHHGDPHHPYYFEVHLQNTPIKYKGMQKHAILVPPPNPHHHANKPRWYPFHWNLGSAQPIGISINLAKLVNYIKVIFL